MSDFIGVIIGATHLLKEFGLPNESATNSDRTYSASTFFAYSQIKKADCDYGCGGVAAMRVGLEQNKPFSMTRVEGAMAFGSVSTALNYLDEQLQGNGLLVLNQKSLANAPFHTIDTNKPLEGDFTIPAIHVTPSPYNFATLLGSGDKWYWESATGSWKTRSASVEPGKHFIYHTQNVADGRLNLDERRNIYFVVPNAAERSPVSDEIKQKLAPIKAQ